MEKATHTTEELQNRIDDLTAAEGSRVESIQAQVQQIRQQLQDVVGATISTTGQIEQLTAVLAEQRRERYRLEGMLQGLSSQA